MKEWLYILENLAIPGMIKIGRSEDHPEILVKSLDQSGACPFGYRILFKICLRDCLYIIQRIRLKLRMSNISSGWFRISAQYSVSLVRNEIAQYILEKLHLEIQSGTDLDLTTLQRVVGSVFNIKEGSYPSNSASVLEEREIMRILAEKIKSKYWANAKQLLNGC